MSSHVLFGKTNTTEISNEDSSSISNFLPQGVEESAARRAQNICAYDVIPSPETVRAVGEDVQEQKQLPGYLGSRGVDCKEVTWTRVFCCTAVATWLQSFRTASEAGNMRLSVVAGSGGGMWKWVSVVSDPFGCCPTKRRDRLSEDLLI